MRNNQRIAMFGGTDYAGERPDRERYMVWEAASYAQQENYFNRTPYLDSGLALVSVFEWDSVKGRTQKLPPELIFQYAPVQVLDEPYVYLDNIPAAIVSSWSCHMTDPGLLRKPADDETLHVVLSCNIPASKDEKPLSTFNLIEFKPDHKLGHSFLLSITYDATGKTYLEMTVKTADGKEKTERQPLNYTGVCTFRLAIDANKRVSVICNDPVILELDIADLDFTYDQGTMNFMRYTGTDYKRLDKVLFQSLHVYIRLG